MARVPITGTSTTTGVTTPSWPRPPWGRTGKGGGGSGRHLVQPYATKLGGLWLVPKSDLQDVSFCSVCRMQTYDSYEESYISAARRERAGGETLGSNSEEAGGQPREVTSGRAGVEDKRLGDLQRFWGQSMCPSFS